MDSSKDKNNSKSKVPKKEKKLKKKKGKKKSLKSRIEKGIVTFKEMLLGESKRQKKNTKIFWGKSFTGLLIFFFIYSLMLISNIKGSVTTPWINQLFGWLTLGEPYIMGVALVFVFFEYMILFCNTKFKQIFFASKRSWIIQSLLSLILVLGNFYVWRYLISNGINVLPTLFVLAMFWLVFQGLKLFYGARSFSTKVESKIVSRYSPIRYVFAMIIPFIILIFLTISVWSYRYYLVQITLDLFSYLTPQIGLLIYSEEMRLILPFLYISLIIIFALISMTYLFTIRKAENRRSGVFDNFAYSLIVFVMFMYLLFQITMYIGLNQNTVAAINAITKEIQSSGGSTSSSSFFSSLIFWIEYAFSMLFLFRAIKGVGKTFGWNAYFLNQDAMIMGFLATIMAQTTSRLAVFDDSFSQELGIYGLLKMDHLIIPFLIMLILGLTLIIYYLKPQETSMFMRIASESVKKTDKSMEIILKFLKQEFIRRGTKYPISEVESKLITITDLKKGLVLSLIGRIGDKYMDVIITEEKTETGTERYIDFISLVEKYQKGSVASTRAKKYMADRLTDTLSKEKRKISLAKNTVTNVKERETFLNALGTGFTRKVREEAKREGLAFTSDLNTTQKEIGDDTKEIIYQIIKTEYLYRVKHPHQYEDISLQVSDISTKVFNTTKISPGMLYPILEDIKKSNINIVLTDTDGNEKTYSDKIIDFCPIDDFEISEALEENRPEKLNPLRKLLSERLEQSLLNRPKYIMDTINLSDEIKDNMNQNIYLPTYFSLDVYWKTLLRKLNKDIRNRWKQNSWSQDYSKLLDIIKEIKESNEKSKDMVKASKHKIEEEELRLEEAKKEQIRKEELRLEEAKKEQIRKEELRLEEAKKEQIRKEELRLEEAKKEQIRKEELRLEQLRLEELEKKTSKKKTSKKKTSKKKTSKKSSNNKKQKKNAKK